MYWVLVKAGLIRKKVRTFFTFMTVFIAFLLYGLLHSMDDLFEGTHQALSANIIIVTPKYNMMYGKMPISHINFINSVEGIKGLAWMDYLAMDMESMVENPVVTALGGDFFNIYTRFKTSEESLEAFQKDREAALVGKLIAEKKGWKIGDRIPIKSSITLKEDGSELWEFNIVGLYETSPQADELGVLVRYDYLDEARRYFKGTASMFIADVDPEDIPRVTSIIDDNFENSADATRSTTESGMAVKMLEDVGDFQLIVSSIMAAVFFTILLIAANTMNQSVRERIPDLAILKSMGYKDAHLFIMVLIECNILVLIGAFIGIFSALLILPLIDAASGGFTEGILGIDTSQILSGLGLGILLASLAGFIPAYKAYSLKVVDALAKG